MLLYLNVIFERGRVLSPWPCVSALADLRDALGKLGTLEYMMRQDRNTAQRTGSPGLT